MYEHIIFSDDLTPKRFLEGDAIPIELTTGNVQCNALKTSFEEFYKSEKEILNTEDHEG